MTVQNQKLMQLNSAISQAPVDPGGHEGKAAATAIPDVAEAEAAVQSLEKERDEIEKRELSQTVRDRRGDHRPPRVVTNPMVARQIEDLRSLRGLEPRSQIAAKDMEIQELNRQPAELEKIIAGYQKRLEDAPLNEQQYNSLLRDFNMAKADYEEMSKRHDGVGNGPEPGRAQSRREPGSARSGLAAGAAVRAEPPGMGAASAPPSGLGLGIMLAAAQEVRNTSLKNLKDVRAYTNMPVLSSIPLLENALLVRRKRRLVWLAWSSAMIVGCILMSGSMYYHLSGI